MVANIAAVGACSLVNFFASHLLVFAAARPRLPATIAVVLGLAVVPLRADDGVVLRATTLAAWQGYERQVEERYGRATGSPFFAGDAFAGAPGWRGDATRGTIPMFQPRGAVPGAAPPDVPDGRIHHWVGAPVRARAHRRQK